MGEFIVEKCIEQVSNHFKLVLLASQRTHDLNIGASNPAQIAEFKNHKNTIVALYEIAEKKACSHELFNLLVRRCEEYVKGNVSNVYNNSEDKLQKLLNFSQGRQVDTNEKGLDI